MNELTAEQKMRLAAMQMALELFLTTDEEDRIYDFMEGADRIYDFIKGAKDESK